jgi:ATP-dependent DNA helicase RecQ
MSALSAAPHAPSTDGGPADPASPLAILQQVFGYAAFRQQQGAVVEHVSAGGSAVVLMPTGAGKSLCYQVPAIARHRRGLGTTLVVSPLIALMQDQVGALEEVGVRAAFLNSTLQSDEAQRVERELMAGRLTLLYAAPERVTNARFMAQLTSLHERGLLSLVAIDEAHCVSQWGHDFREDYLHLSMLHERFPDVPRVALTATADEHTRADMLARLQLQDARLYLSSFDRPNIRYTIVERDNARTQLLRFLRREHDGPEGHDSGIVYCGTRRKVEETAEWLADEGFNALPYHAGLDAGVRKRHQDRFLREDSIVMVATIAFGMGIDKPDVRFVAHLDLPKNIEGYYQETGRAGRDGEPANAWLAYGLADVVNQRRMIDESPAGEEFKRIQRGKLDALLALAESLDCRRVRLLAYFGETAAPPDAGPPQGGRSPDGHEGAPVVPLGQGEHAVPPVGANKCGNCDNCMHPPARWDATEAARKALSCIYRFRQHSNLSFGAGHLIDVLRGKRTDKVAQHGHADLSTFGCGADLPEAQWRGVLRQLIALGHLQVEGEYGTLELTASARAVLKGEQAIVLRAPREPRASRTARGTKRDGRDDGTPRLPPVAAALDPNALQRFAALKAWRAEVASEHNLPAYVVFHDATLAQMAQDAPDSLDALAQISGVGAKKLEAYGVEILRVLGAG